MVGPGCGGEERRRRQRNPGIEMKPLRQAAPGPVLRATDELRRQRIPFDIPAHANELRRAPDRERLETALIERFLPDGLVSTMPSNRMGSSYPSHEPRKGRRGRCVDHQVPVVGEHAVRHESHRIPFEACAENPEKRAIVERARENREPAHSSVDDVEEWAGQRMARATRHKGLGLRKRHAGRLESRPPAPGCGNLWKNPPSPSPS